MNLTDFGINYAFIRGIISASIINHSIFSITAGVYYKDKIEYVIEFYTAYETRNGKTSFHILPDTGLSVIRDLQTHKIREIGRINLEDFYQEMLR